MIWSLLLPVLMTLQPLSLQLVGDDHLLQKNRDSLTVYVFLEDECMISQFYTYTLSNLYDKYKGQHVGFVGFFPTPSTGEEQIRMFADSFNIHFPMYPDPDQRWTRKYGATITPEVAVWDHRSDLLIYRGRIDDSYVRVGKRRLHPQNFDLEEVILSWLSNQAPETPVLTQAIGCFISFTNRE